MVEAPGNFSNAKRGTLVTRNRSSARTRRRAAGDVVGDFIERVADRELGGDLGDRKAVALEASAEERDTRGFISITTMRPSSGLTPNCTLDPPVSTPISRSTASEASRMIWYSLSVSVSAGATVIIAGMHAHRIEVLDRADDDAIVLLVAHHFHLELFPAEHGSSIKTSLVGEASSRAFDDVEELFRL